MNAMNPAWEPPTWGLRGGRMRHRPGRPPFGPMAAAMDAAGAPVPPPFEGPVDDEATARTDPAAAAAGTAAPASAPASARASARRRGFPGPRGRRRGRRTARGDIRAAVLALVAEQPRHGYEIIQEIAERTGGAWRPSPGSVYPTLSQLEDEGLVRVEQSDGRRVVHLTEAGTDLRRRAPRRAGRGLGVGRPGRRRATPRELWEQLAQLHAATQQVLSAGTPEQIAAATAALAEARKTIYRLLAE